MTTTSPTCPRLAVEATAKRVGRPPGVLSAFLRLLRDDHAHVNELDALEEIAERYGGRWGDHTVAKSPAGYVVDGKPHSHRALRLAYKRVLGELGWTRRPRREVSCPPRDYVSCPKPGAPTPRDSQTIENASQEPPVRRNSHIPPTAGKSPPIYMVPHEPSPGDLSPSSTVPAHRDPPSHRAPTPSNPLLREAIDLQQRDGPLVAITISEPQNTSIPADVLRRFQHSLQQVGVPHIAFAQAEMGIHVHAIVPADYVNAFSSLYLEAAGDHDRGPGCETIRADAIWSLAGWLKYITRPGSERL